MRLFARISPGLARLARSSVVRFWGFGGFSFGLRCFLGGILRLRYLSDHEDEREAGTERTTACVMEAITSSTGTSVPSASAIVASL